MPVRDGSGIAGEGMKEEAPRSEMKKAFPAAIFLCASANAFSEFPGVSALAGLGHLRIFGARSEVRGYP